MVRRRRGLHLQGWLTVADSFDQKLHRKGDIVIIYSVTVPSGEISRGI